MSLLGPVRWGSCCPLGFRGTRLPTATAWHLRNGAPLVLSRHMACQQALATDLIAQHFKPLLGLGSA